MKALSKDEFMSKVINDLYNKRFLANQRLSQPVSYAIDRCNRTKNFRR